MIGWSQRPQRDNIRHSQETDIHASGAIRTRNLSKRAVVDPRFRRHGHWDRLLTYMVTLFLWFLDIHGFFVVWCVHLKPLVVVVVVVVVFVGLNQFTVIQLSRYLPISPLLFTWVPKNIGIQLPKHSIMNNGRRSEFKTWFSVRCSTVCL